MRLESLRPAGSSILEGEFTRIQKTNLPSEVEGDKRIALKTTNPLGHGIVFRYDSQRSVLGAQYDVRVASPGRLVDYIQYMVDGTSFHIRPIVRDDMWNRFNQGPARKILIGIARPANIADLDKGAAAPLISSMQNMGDAYEAPNIKIEMSMGGNKGALAESVKALAKYIRSQFLKGNLEVTNFKAVTEMDGKPNEVIDLLEDILAIKEELPLHDKDPDKNYDIRIKALKAAMNAWIK